MRGFSLGSIALVAACSSADGVYIEARVPPGMEVAQVDLFLATLDCQDDAGIACNRLTPPSTDSPRLPVTGEVYFVDGIRPFVSVPDGDGSAWFHLDPTSTFEIKTAVAVARDAQLRETGVAILLPIDLDVTQHVRVDLAPVMSQQVSTGVAQPAAEVWSAPSSDYRCVAAAVENRVVYIVPDHDPDCDSIDTIDNECFPNTYLGKAPVTTELLAQTCAEQSLFTQVCLLGSRGCDEANPQPADDNCTLSQAPTYCVPDRACSCDTVNIPCLTELFGDPLQNGGTHIACVVETELDPNGGTRSCVDKRGDGDPLSSSTCVAPAVGALNDGLAGFVDGATTIAFPGVDGGVTIAPLVDGNCTVSIAPPNTRFTANPPLQPIRTLVKLQVSAPGNLEEKFMIVPLEVKFQQPADDCVNGVQTRCTLVAAADEHVGKCAQ